MKRICFALMMIISSVNAWGIDEYVWNDSCDKNQMSLNECAKSKFDFYDKILNKLYNQQIHYLTKENLDFKKSIGFKYDNAKTLKDAQVKWIKFRDADCLYEAGPQDGGGSIGPYMYWSCMADRTKERAIQLEKYVSCRENGCPI